MKVCILFHKIYRKIPSLPTAFLGKRASSSTNKKIERLFTYDRDIVCLPQSFVGKTGLITIPRQREKREFLACNHLCGKIQLSSAMSQDEIYKEIRSVFRRPMDNDSLFRFEILQNSGGNTKSLNIPVLSPSYKWTAGAICGKNAKVPIYILARDKLKVYIYSVYYLCY